MSDQRPVSGQPLFPPPAQAGFPPSGPAQGGYPPPPGYPPYPGPSGQHPGFPNAGFQPSPGRNRTPLIVAIAAAVVVMIALGIGTVVLLTRDGDADTAPRASGSSPGRGSSPADRETVRAPGLYTLTLPAGFKATNSPEPPTFLVTAFGPGGGILIRHYILRTSGAAVDTQEAFEAVVMATERKILGSIAETQRPSVDNHLAVMYVGAQATNAYVLVIRDEAIWISCKGDSTSSSQENTKKTCSEALASLKVG